MKIAMILPSLEKSGPGIQVESLCKEFLKQNCVIEVFYIRETEHISLEFYGIKTTKLCFNKDFFDSIKNFDVIHSNGFYPDLLGLLIGYYANNIVHFTTMHNFVKEDIASRYSKMRAKLYSSIWLMIVKKIKHKIVFTNIAKKYYEPIIGKTIYIAGSGIDIPKIEGRVNETMGITEDFNKSIGFFKNENYKIIGATSILTSVKRIDIIINALVELKDYAAIFVGGGSEETKLIKLATDLKVIDRCMFIGFKENPYVYLNYFDIYAMPSSSESFGLSLFEAIVSRLPVICCDLPIYEELLNARSLHKFDGTVSDFIKVIRLIDVHDTDATFEAYNEVKEKYSMNKIALNYYSCYQDALKYDRV